MPRPKTRLVQIEQRRQIVVREYLRGATQTQIAVQLGVDQTTVSADLRAIRDQWLASSLRDFDAIKAEQLARIDAIEAAAWAAWDRSLRVFRSRKTERQEGEQPRVTLLREERVGDPRFLEKVAWCVEMRLKLIGALDQEERKKRPDQEEKQNARLDDFYRRYSALHSDAAPGPDAGAEPVHSPPADDAATSLPGTGVS